MKEQMMRAQENFQKQSEELKKQQQEMLKQNDIINQVIGDLFEEKIITTRDNLSFRITNDELIVNGVKQAEAVHKKILAKYVKGPNDCISLSYNTGDK